jgi:GTPase SAR1 family protein
MPRQALTKDLSKALVIAEKAIKASQVISSLANAENTNSAKVLDSQRKKLGEGIFQLLVLGEFKNGKSTLLNSFLGEKLLPTKQAPATAVITRIFHGDPSEDVKVHYVDGTVKSISAESFRNEFKLEIQDHDSSVADRFKDVAYADIPSDLALCRDGVILVDSPGLAENPARTQVTQGFFKQSTAAVLLLDATQPLSQEEERWAHDLLGSFGDTGVFLVVNKINLVDHEEVDEIKVYVRRRIEKIRERYQQKPESHNVYFVDARLALSSSCAGDEAGFSRSGVKELLDDLSIFLSSSGREKTAITLLSRIIKDLSTEQESLLTNWKGSASSSVDELKKRKIECQDKLQHLEVKAEDLREVFKSTGVIVADATCNNLESFISERERCWVEESEEGLPLTGISALDGFKAPFEKLWGMMAAKPNEVPEKAKLEQAVASGIETYIQRILLDWANQVPQDSKIQKEITRVRKRVNQDIKEISIDLDSIKSIFAGVTSIRDEAETTRMTQAFIGMILLDPSQVTGSILGGGDWTAFLRRYLIEVVIVAVLSTIWWPAAIMGYILAEVIHIGIQGATFQENIRKKIGEQLFPKIKQELASKKEELKERVAQQFSDSGAHVYQEVMLQIHEVENQQNTIIAQIEEDSNRVWQQIREANTLLEGIRKCSEEVSLLIA